MQGIRTNAAAQPKLKTNHAKFVINKSHRQFNRGAGDPDPAIPLHITHVYQGLVTPTCTCKSFLFF
jgi:hypothetical protein